MIPRSLFICACSSILVAGAAFGQEKKLEEPDAAALARAEQTIKKLYRIDSHKFASDMHDLAVKLISQAMETQDDHAARFVLYREAAALAAKSGDFVGAMAVLDELGQQFDTDLGALKVGAIKAAATAGKTASPKALCASALDVAADAFGANDPNIARELIDTAASIAEKLKSEELKARVEVRRKQLKQVLEVFAKYRTALRKVESNPADADANLVVGRYACLIKGDWNRGLSLLARGADATMKALANRDMKNPEDASEQVELADAWWDVGESADEIYRRQALGRAAYWYSEAIPRLQGLTLAKARDRVRTIYVRYPGLEPGSSSGASVFAQYSGVWEIRYANTARRYYVIDMRGNALLLNHGSVSFGRLTPISDGEQMRLVFPLLPKERGRTEQFSVKGGELLVQHFNPPTRLSTTGVGPRRDLPEKRPNSAKLPTTNMRDIAGIWICTHSNKLVRVYVLGPKGTGMIVSEDRIDEGTLIRKEDHILLDCNDNKLDRIKLIAGKLRIDSFDPASTYPSASPAAVGTALRVSR
jgi:hypothetical protein